MFADNELTIDARYANDLKFSNEIVADIKRVFASFGYREVATPTLERDISLAASAPADNKIKFFSADGRLMALRSDVTLSVAKLIAGQFIGAAQQLKFYYVVNVFRSTEQFDGRSQEFLQGGIEYYGSDDISSDGDVVCTAVAVLDALKIPSLQIDIGHVQYLMALLASDANLQANAARITQLIEDKNEPELRAFVSSLTIGARVAEALLAIPRLFGEPQEVIARASRFVVNDAMQTALDDLMALYDYLTDSHLAAIVNFDLGFTKPMDYYTGLVYRGYMNQYGKPLFQGGRYDNLLANYGTARPASGLGMNIETLLEVINMYQIKEDVNSYTDYLIVYAQERRGEALDVASALRDSGYSVETNPRTADINSYLRTADYRNTKQLIEVSDVLRVFNIVENSSRSTTLAELLNDSAQLKTVPSIH